jgi:hypothetical protein
MNGHLTEAPSPKSFSVKKHENNLEGTKSQFKNKEERRCLNTMSTLTEK